METILLKMDPSLPLQQQAKKKKVTVGHYLHTLLQGPLLDMGACHDFRACATLYYHHMFPDARHVSYNTTSSIYVHTYVHTILVQLVFSASDNICNCPANREPSGIAKGGVPPLSSKVCSSGA